VTEARMQSDYAPLRGQLILIVILAVAIALRSIAIGEGDAPRGPINIPTANEVQHDTTHREPSSPDGLRSSNSTDGLRMNEVVRDSRFNKELQK
jgi:hypothetical protein